MSYYNTKENEATRAVVFTIVGYVLVFMVTLISIIATKPGWIIDKKTMDIDNKKLVSISAGVGIAGAAVGYYLFTLTK
jgi:hypothetical protein